MTLAAALTWIDAGTEEPLGSSRRVAAPVAVERTLAAVSDALGVDAPVVLETERGTMVAIRGDLEDVAIDLRARPIGHGDRESWEIELVTGVLGRDRPDVELVPDPGHAGARPSHGIGRTHRARGRLRDVEELDDTLLDALEPFTSAHWELWSDGSRVHFGGDLSAFDCERVAAVVRALVRRE